MKTRALLAILALILCSCASIEPTPEPPKPPQGPFIVYTRSETGQRAQSWETTEYRYTMFPRSLEFKDATGKTVRLTGSFEIARKP